MTKNRKGFTLVEVIVSMVIFTIGVLSVAALGALNYMYLNANQAKAKLHIRNESTMDDTQSWFREPSTTPGLTRFEDVWNAGFSSGDTLRIFTTGNMETVVLFDSTAGDAANSSDAKIYIWIASSGQSGPRTYADTLNFCISNYAIGGE